MMRNWLFLLAMVFGPAALSAQSRRDTADTVQLIRLEDVWNAAHLQHDAAALDRLWEDDFVLTLPDGTVLTKAAALTRWREGTLRFSCYETSDLRIRVYGDAAVVTGQLDRRSASGARDHWRFTKVRVRRTGTWRVVAMHTSLIPKEGLPSGRGLTERCT